jgi:hypothetical protein
MNVISTLHSYCRIATQKAMPTICGLSKQHKWNVASPFYATCSGLRSKIELLVLNTFKKKLSIDPRRIYKNCHVLSRNRNLSSEHATNLNNCKGRQQIENSSSNFNTSSTNTTSVFLYRNFWLEHCEGVHISSERPPFTGDQTKGATIFPDGAV